MPTYKEQFDKLTAAYIKDKVNSFSCHTCFIGNMLNNTYAWAMERRLDFDSFKMTPLITSELDPEYAFYTMQEICDLENNFLERVGFNNEETLFLAFESTLELLKKIHQDKGEVIDETPVFTKRKLAAI